MPPLLDATSSGQVRLEAQKGRTAFAGSSRADTWGFNQPFLGPTLRMSTGRATQVDVLNWFCRKVFAVGWIGSRVVGTGF
ncbi:multicopper oxidase domain-containing protein [Shimia litoralis]